MDPLERTPPKLKAKKLLRHFRKEYPDYTYLREVFKHIRQGLNVEITPVVKKETVVIPTEDEIKRYYTVVWNARKMQHVILFKVLLYTGMRVSELVRVKIADIDFVKCHITIPKIGRKKARTVPFPDSFKEVFALYVESSLKKGATYLFESSWKNPYTDRGIRRILEIYAKKAGMDITISPRKMRHFLLAWMKKQHINDALIQSVSGIERASELEKYNPAASSEAQQSYNQVIDKLTI